MKRRNIGLLLSTILAAAAHGGEVIQTNILRSGPHTRIVKRVTESLTTFHKPTWRTNSYTEVAASMNYFENGEWKESVAEIQLVQGGGAAALKGRNTAVFEPNINTFGAIKVFTAIGEQFASHVIGLAYRDVATGKSVLIAEVKDSIGAIHPPNQVLYADAFTDIKADIRYTYTIEAFEQDVVLRENPPAPEAFGLNGATTRLELWTEFVAAPDHATQTATLRVGSGPAALLTDETLKFDDLVIGNGKAFSVPATDRQVRVAKQWGNVENRTFLIETVWFPSVEPMLRDLPAVQEAAFRKGPRRAMVAANLTAPPQRKERRDVMRMAASKAPANGFVLDYAIVTTITNFTFVGNGTYFVPTNVTLVTPTIQGGAVFKFNTNGAKLTIQGALTCETDPYLPAVFTAKDDNSVGEWISGSTGNPAGYYAGTALFIDDTASDLSYLQIRYAAKAVEYDSDTTGTHRLSHSQIYSCGYGIVASNTTFSLQNILAYRLGTNISGGNATGRLEHITFDVANTLNSGSSLAVFATNSIFAGVTNSGGSYTGANVTFTTSSAGLFTNCAAGEHYLIANSTNRNAGTTNISASLLAALRKKTTDAPILLTNAVTANTSLSAQAQRDTDTPDRGYHYEALDYVVRGVTVSNATLLLTNGVCVAVDASTNFGIQLRDNAILRAHGKADAMVNLTSVKTVQEALPSGYNITKTITSAGTGPKLYAQFTRFLGNYFHIYEDHSYGSLTRISLKNSEIHSGGFGVSPAPLTTNSTEFNNVLFARAGFEHYAYNTVSTIGLYNNTFLDGGIFFWQVSGEANYNLFVRVNGITCPCSGYSTESITQDRNFYTAIPQFCERRGWMIGFVPATRQG